MMLRVMGTSKDEIVLLLVFERRVLMIFGAICVNSEWRIRYNGWLFALQNIAERILTKRSFSKSNTKKRALKSTMVGSGWRETPNKKVQSIVPKNLLELE